MLQDLEEPREVFVRLDLKVQQTYSVPWSDANIEPPVRPIYLRRYVFAISNEASPFVRVPVDYVLKVNLIGPG